MKTLAMVAALIGTTLSAAGGTGAQQAQPNFRTQVDLVGFSVTALDKKGKFVSDLRAEDFAVYEDGVKQTLKYFSPAAAPDSAMGPLHLGVLFDASGSMEEDINLSRTAAIRFLKTLNDAEDMTLVDFDTEIRVARYGPDDFARLVERIRSRKPDGFTALYDALAVYLRGAAGLDGRKILVLYTDGGDNDSSINFGDVLTLLRAADVTVYTIGFTHRAGSSALELRSRLQRMAETTGGESFEVTAARDLDGVYEKVRDEISAQYAMGYVSSNARQDGSWRKVEIKVARQNGRDVNVRTRRGYFAPYNKEAAR